MSTRAEARLPLSEASLLSVAEAVREIGGREAEVRRWLEGRGLVRDVPGLGKRVVWGDVLHLVRTGQGPTAPAPKTTPRPSTLPRVPLGKRRE